MCLAKVLEDNWHVPKDAIEIVTDHGKTGKQNIKDLIQKQLIDPCSPGDVVVFAYAGHGFQVFDDSKSTKLSQALVPADARNLAAPDPKRGLEKGDVDPDSLLTGPEIGALFDAFKEPAHLTSNVTLIIDACHSGSITRGSFIARGLTNPAVERYLARGGKRQTQDTLKNELSTKRGLVCLSAADAEQTAYEDGNGGIFIQALLPALQNPGNEHHNYASLLNQIKADWPQVKLPSPQDPQLGGDGSRQIFGDEYYAPRPSMDVRRLANGRIVMSGGQVFGIKTGFLVGIYKDGADLKGDPAWKAKVTSVSTGECELVPDAESLKTIKSLVAGQGRVIDGRPDGSISVYIGDLAPGLQTELKGQLKDISIVDPWAPITKFDYRVTRAKSAGAGDPNAWEIIDAADNWSDPMTLGGSIQSDGAALAEELQSIARRNAVEALEPPEKPTTRVEMQLIPATLAGDSVAHLDEDHPIRPDQAADKNLVFAIRVRLVKSVPTAPGFVPCIILLNVNPHPNVKGGEKAVKQLWPDPTGAPTEAASRRLDISSGWMYLGKANALVPPGHRGEIDAFGVDADEDGAGPELFKVFATDQDTDFSPILDPTRGRGATTILGQTLRNFEFGLPRSRGNLRTAGPATEHWCTAEITLTVVKNL